MVRDTEVGGATGRAEAAPLVAPSAVRRWVERVSLLAVAAALVAVVVVRAQGTSPAGAESLRVVVVDATSRANGLAPRLTLAVGADRPVTAGLVGRRARFDLPHALRPGSSLRLALGAGGAPLVFVVVAPPGSGPQVSTVSVRDQSATLVGLGAIDTVRRADPFVRAYNRVESALSAIQGRDLSPADRSYQAVFARGTPSRAAVFAAVTGRVEPRYGRALRRLGRLAAGDRLVAAGLDRYRRCVALSDRAYVAVADAEAPGVRSRAPIAAAHRAWDVADAACGASEAAWRPLRALARHD